MLCSSIDVIEVSLLVSGGVLTSAFLMTAFRSAIFLYCCVKMKITEICFSAPPFYNVQHKCRPIVRYGTISIVGLMGV
jgi:hypothetical protein